MVGKNYVEIAPEATYGTPPETGWTGLLVADDSHKVNVLTHAPKGIKRGQQGPILEGRRSTPRDGTGTLKPYLASNGMAKLLRLAFGAPVITTPVGATLTRKMVFSTSDAASAFSIATQIGREMKAGGVDPDTMAGGQATELRFMQALGPESGGVTDEALAKMELDLAYQRLVRDFEGSESTTYVDPLLYFSVGECSLYVGPDLDNLVAKCLNKFELKLPTGLDTNDQCISGSLVKEKAVRGSLPEPTLALGWTYQTREFYDAYLDGDILAFRSKWEAAEVEIEAGFSPSITIDVAALQLTGDTPQSAEDAKTTQDLPATVLHNGTDPMVEVTLITSDTAV